MWDINDTYKKASEELGFPLISMYDMFTEYYQSKGVTLDSLLKDGLHPNDKGYDVMFDLLVNKLEI